MNRRRGGDFIRGLLVAVAALALGACDPAPAAPSALAGNLSDLPVLPSAAPQETAEILLFLEPGTDAEAYAREQGLVLRRTLKSDPDAHVFVAADPAEARRQRDRADARVRQAFLNRRSAHQKMPFVPNDPYYSFNNPVGYPGQWHLGGSGAPTTHHANVVPAWTRDTTGTGVVVGIVDDGLEIAHPDLSPNHAAAESWDFGDNNNNPSPVYSGDNHGTSVAGVAAARGGNATGVTGAAPLASLAGLRVDFPNQTEDMFYDATIYRSSGGTTTIKVKNHSYGYNICYYPTALEKSGLALSAAAGTVHLVAAGNWRGQEAQDSNKLDLQASPDAITVAALGSDGKYATYSSFGANVFVAAPSNSGTGYGGITTTDRTGNSGYNSAAADPFPDNNYTSQFGGTSSATPLAAGVMALVKQVQPGLNNRFAKHLLVRTSFQVDPNDSTVTGGGDGVTAGSAWKTNAAGFKFNQNYGFGRIDADALTQQAPLYGGVSALQTESTASIGVSTAIPDNNAAGLTRNFSIAATTPLEEMLVRLNVTHANTGDVEAYLTSPSGTVSRLAIVAPADNTFPSFNWTFTSNAFWGENPSGSWTIQVKDVLAGSTGTWNNFSATARMGRLLDWPVVTSIVRAGANPTNATAVDYTVTFNESVTGVNAADFATVATGSVTGASVTGVAGSGSVYTVTVATGTGDGTLRLDVIDNDSIVDATANPLGGVGAGNGNYTSGQAYTIDKTAPSIVRVTSTTGNGAYGVGANINVTVDFTEPVTMAGGNLRVTLDTTDVVAISPFGPAATAAGIYAVGAGDTSADLNSLSPLTLSAGTLRDAAGNNCVLTIPAGQNLASLKAIVIDTQPPTVSMTSTATDPTNVSPIAVTVTFSESVVNFVAGDIAAANGSVGGFSGSGASYSFNLTPTGQGLVSANIAAGVAADAAGNGNTVAPAFSRSFDSVAPTVSGVSSTTADGVYGVGQTVVVTVTFSETVTVASGTPQITLETGSPDAVVNYSGGSGSNTLSFNYVVAAGHQSTDLDYVAAGSMAFNGSTIRDAAGNNAVITLAAPGAAGSLGFAKDIAIVDSFPPAALAGLAQRKSDGTTAIAVGGTTDEGTVILSGVPTDPDLSQLVRLQIEIRATGAAFLGTPTTTTALFSSGSPVSVTITGLANGPRHWQARAVDDLGVGGTWTVFGGNLDPGDADFNIQVPAGNAAPAAPASMGQFRPGGIFPLGVGASIDETNAVFKGLLSDPEGGTLRLELEIKPVGTPLSGAATAVTDFLPSGTEAALALSSLTAGPKHWAARAVDAGGAASAWTSFGGNVDVSDADLVVDLAGNLPPDLPSTLAQRDAATGAPQPAGYVDDDRSVVFTALLSDPAPLQGLMLQVEVRPLGTAFSGTPTASSPAVLSGLEAQATLTGIADDDYHWQARTADAAGAFSAWVSFGGNAETAADFSILAAANTAPGAPGSLSQVKSDGTTSIGVGASTPETQVGFRATATDPDGDRWKLQVELRAIATPFSGAATAESVLLPSGVPAYFNIAGLAGGSYHWRARSVDENGLASAWGSFGGNADGVADVTVNAASNVLPSATAPGQFRSDGTTAIAPVGTTTEGIVVIRATVDSGDPGQLVRLRVELRPNATPFSGAASATGPWVASGTNVAVVVGGLANGTSYHWQLWAEDTDGAVSAPTLFPPGDPDFTKAANAAPGLPAGEGQFLLDGTTPLGLGATTPETGVSFAALLTDSNLDSLRLQVEIQPVGRAFSGFPSITGPAAASGSVATAAIAGLPNLTGYHWQCRAIDSSNQPSSAWSTYGGNSDPGDADFLVEEAYVPPGGSGNDSSSDGCGLAASGIRWGALALLALLIIGRKQS